MALIHGFFVEVRAIYNIYWKYLPSIQYSPTEFSSGHLMRKGNYCVQYIVPEYLPDKHTHKPSQPP